MRRPEGRLQRQAADTRHVNLSGFAAFESRMYAAQGFPQPKLLRPPHRHPHVGTDLPRPAPYGHSLSLPNTEHAWKACLATARILRSLGLAPLRIGWPGGPSSQVTLKTWRAVRAAFRTDSRKSMRSAAPGVPSTRSRLIAVNRALPACLHTPHGRILVNKRAVNLPTSREAACDTFGTTGGQGP